MFVFGIVLIFGGLLATVAGASMNTVFLNMFAADNPRFMNLRLEQMNHEADFQFAWIFNGGPGTIVMIIGAIGIVIGIALLVENRKQNKNMKYTDRRRKQMGKRVPK